MSNKYRVVIELYSDSNPDLIERKVVDEKNISSVKTIYDLGLRHKEQIGLLQKLQDTVLTSQIKYLKEDIEFCPKCGNKVCKQGYEKCNFHSVFTDHEVKTQRLQCGKCNWRSTPSIKSLFGTSIHPDLAKIQSELGGTHSYRESEKVLDLQSASKRAINNHDRIKHIVGHIGKQIEIENRQLDISNIESEATGDLIVQVDGGHLKSSEKNQRSFEVMTSIIYKPESVVKIEGQKRGKIYNKNCTASALNDNQESIKRDTLIAAARQGMTKDTKITAICDGAQNCWSIIDYLRPYCKEILLILDWFHIAMRFKNITIPKGKREEFDKIKWHLWHGNPNDAINKLNLKIAELPIKYHKKINNLITYIDNNRDYIINYERHYNNNQVFTSNVAESNVESLINQRCKGQQHMIWSREGVQPLLQIRAAICSNEWNQRWENTVLSGLKKAA